MNQQAFERLMDFLESETYRQDPASIQAFLEEYPQCETAWEEIRQGMQVLDQPDLQVPQPRIGWETIQASYKQEVRLKEAKTITFTVPRWTIAAACGIIGLAIGLMWPSSQSVSEDSSVVALVEELRETQLAMQVLLLQSPDASQRMRAVSMSRELPSTPATTTAWLDALERDPSVNVRMAALDVLRREGLTIELKKEIIDRMAGQQSPMMRMTMADLALSWETEAAIPNINRWLEEEELPAPLRSHLDSTLQKLSITLQKPRL